RRPLPLGPGSPLLLVKDPDASRSAVQGLPRPVAKRAYQATGAAARRAGGFWRATRGGTGRVTLKGRGPALDEAHFGGESQEEFLSRIRARLQGAGYVADHPSFPAGPLEDEEQASYEQKAERFMKTLVELGGEAYRAPSREGAFRLIRDLLLHRDVKGVLTSGGDWSQCRAILEEAGIAVESWDEVAFSHGEADRELARADRWGAGLLWADYAVAEL